ncbi:FAD/NAD(P)-binding protein [Nosocomiicoccus ampullae]|uniref:NAD(P)/FAD-binding protein YdhS n=1 Tax=Nosocomiicoccus ampullae TaxID=489910 RepID=A0A9Q2CXU9_9STAP|nr:FAD/NAD(P)-binding protein [Nosocomiicoccus ampullae]MBB5175626.1 putative NAD(P)/FAD-binding protein YdhS [Nosocomiicoccus ampullae]QYA47023.1 FAD/NAD(P)-binding protein [Nosocomiicoccus ampullae]
MKIAIVGAGMAGIGTLRYYIDHINIDDMEIYIFDDRNSAGIGYPFGPDDDALLLNQRLKKMTLEPWDDKKEYVKYLKETEPELLNHEFITRPEFGKYSKDVFLEYIKDERVKFVPSIVNDIDVKKDKYVIKTDNDYEVDVVHLCIGQLPQTDIYNLKDIKKYIATPFPIEDHSELLLNSKSVGIIGTNLTSLDIIMYLYKHNYKNDIIVTSRSGTVPFIRGNEAEVSIDVNALKNKKDITIHDIVEIFKEETKRQGIDFKFIKKLNEMPVLETLKYQLNHLDTLGVLEETAEELSEVLREVWNDLSLEDKKYYMKHIKGVHGQLTGPFPKMTAEKIVELIEAGQLTYVSGVEDICYNDEFVIHSEDGDYSAYVMVSAVGPNLSGKNLADENNASPLVKTLLEKGVLEVDELGGIKITYPEFSVISEAGVLERMKLYGNLVSTTHINNSGVNLILKKIPQSIEEIFHGDDGEEGTLS